MRQLIRSSTFVLAAVVLSACSLPRGAAINTEVLREQNAANPTFSVVPVARANVSQIASWPVTGWSGRYNWLSATRGPESNIIRPGDRVDLVIWDSQENSLLTGEAEKTVSMNGIAVSPGGSIFVPYLDEVVIGGLSPVEARSRIQTALEPIVPSAQVQLSLQAGKQNSVDMVSGVAKPGTYPLPDRNYTILSMIAQGGGIATTLRNPVVRLIRDGRSYEIPAGKLFSEASTNVTMRGNDKVLVEEDKRYFTALGATGSEKLIYFEKDSISALESLSIIGGLADARANPKGVLVLREYSAKAVRADGKGPVLPQVVFTFDLTSADGLFAARNFQINPRDTVLATESPINAARTIIGLIGTSIGVANNL